MNHPYDFGPQTEPHPSDYKPRALLEHGEEHSAAYVPRSHDVIAAQELLDWMRFRGFGAQSVTVGPQGVQIVGLVDLYPRKPIAPTQNAGPGDLYDDPAMGGPR